MLDIKFVFQYVWSIDKWYLLLRLPIVVVSSLKPFILIVFPAQILDSIMNGDHTKNIVTTIVVMVLLQLLSEILLHLFNQMLTQRYNYFEYKHATTMGRKIMNVSFHLTEDSEILNNVEHIKRIGYIEKALGTLFSFVSSFITISGLVWVLSEVNVFIIITMIIVIVVNLLLNRKSKQYNYQWQKEAAPYRRRNEYLLRLMYGFQYGKEVRINNMEPYLTSKYEQHSGEYLSELHKITNKFLVINSSTSLMRSIQLLVVYVSLTTSALLGAITIAEFTKFVNAINTLTSSLMSVSDGFVEMKNNFNYIEELRSFFSLPSYDNQIESKRIEDRHITIEFRNVSFKYPNTNHFALENVSVVIPAKSKITIVGLNGSGKTTFIKLMLGLYKPSSGSIYINGVNVNEMNLKDYWKFFSCAFQDFRVFSYPIKENVVLTQVYDEKQLNNIIEQCGLFEAIDALPLKMNTPIYKFLDDAGVEFSGGETQKIAIARAIYKDSSVIILDEPLASLDPLAEYNMYYNIHKMVQDRTCIFVSHRLTLAKGCDKILVFDKGHLIESGTHDELMKKNAKYAEMYIKQSSFYLKKECDSNGQKEN